MNSFFRLHSMHDEGIGVGRLAYSARIILVRRWISNQLVEINEVFLIGLLFGGNDAFSLADEILRSEWHP